MLYSRPTQLISNIPPLQLPLLLPQPLIHPHLMSLLHNTLILHHMSHFLHHFPYRRICAPSVRLTIASSTLCHHYADHTAPNFWSHKLTIRRSKLPRLIPISRTPRAPTPMSRPTRIRRSILMRAEPEVRIICAKGSVWRGFIAFTEPLVDTPWCV